MTRHDDHTHPRPRAPRAHRVLAAACSLLALALALPALTAAPAHAGGTAAAAGLAPPTAPPAAPRGFAATRDPDSPLDLLLTWRPPADSSAVVRYDVSVVSRGQARVAVVPAAQGSYRVVGGADSASATWRVRVGSRDSSGAGGETGWVIVWPAVPSVPTAVAGGRGQGDRSRVAVTWAAPLRNGYAPVDDYRVELVRLRSRSSQVVRTAGTSAVFEGVDPGDTYVVRVTATNALGSSPEARLMVGSTQPGTPRSFVAARTPGRPSTVELGWEAPSYTGYGPITGYRLGWRRPGGRFHWDVDLPAGARRATVTQHVADRRFWSLRALNDGAASRRTVDVRVGRTSDAPDPVVVPVAAPVAVSVSGRTVRVDLGDAVPLAATRVRVALTPQADTDFRDAADVPRESRTVEIGDVPDGLYLVTVTADLPTGATVLHSAGVRVGAPG